MQQGEKAAELASAVSAEASASVEEKKSDVAPLAANEGKRGTGDEASSASVAPATEAALASDCTATACSEAAAMPAPPETESATASTEPAAKPAPPDAEVATAVSEPSAKPPLPSTEAVVASAEPDAAKHAPPDTKETTAPTEPVAKPAPLDTKEAAASIESGAKPASTAQEEPLKTAWGAVLPEDAPPGSEAHSKVRFEGNHKWPSASFMFGTGPDKIRFQVTLANSGSEENTLVIARACYAMFEQGLSFDVVKQFRQECYGRIRDVKEEAAGLKRDSRGRLRRSSSNVASSNTPPPSATAPVRSVPPPAVAAVAQSEVTPPQTAAVAAAIGNGAAKGDGSNVSAHAVDGDNELQQPAGVPPTCEPPSGAAAGRALDTATTLEDAPPDSAIHQLLKFDKCNKTHFFTIPGQDDKKKFSVSSKKPGVSMDESARIARLCYLHFEQGLSKEEVTAERDRLLAAAPKDKSASKAPQGNGTVALADATASKRLKRTTSKDFEAISATKTTADAASSKTERATKQDEKMNGQVDQSGTKEDAPPGHPAWEKVKSRISANGHGGNYGLCRFEFFRADGTKEAFQTTVRACGDSAADCQRVARLCYVKFEEGWSMEQVKEYRGRLYEEVCKKTGTYVEKESQPSKKRRSGRRKRKGEVEAGAAHDVKRRKKASALEEQVEALRAANKLTGAVRIEGRDLGAKNASINGIYAVVDGSFDGLSAYEKAGGGQPRFLFYSKRKGRWKINDQLDDAKNGFAFAKVRDGGTAPSDHSPALRWQVFDGKEGGYKEDAAVQCSAVVVEAKEAEATDEAKEAEAAEEASAEDDSSGSSSSSSSGSDNEDEGGSDGPVSERQAASGDGAGAGLVRDSMQAVPRKPRGRVCAKMLVRAGLRCSCHFSFVGQCPGFANGR